MKSLSARRPKAEAERDDAAQRKHAQAAEIEDLRAALLAALKEGDDLQREISATQSTIREVEAAVAAKTQVCGRVVSCYEYV